MEAKKNTINKSKGTNIKNNFENILKEGFTIEDAERIIKENREKNHKLQLKKEIAKDLLQNMEEISKNDYLLLSDKINQINDINALNIILRLLNKSYCFGDDFNEEIIQTEIKKDKIIDLLL